MSDQTSNNPENKHQWWDRVCAYARSSIPVIRSVAHGMANSMNVARPLAYASEVGESVKSVVPKVVYRSLWGLSIGYVAVDTSVQVYNLSEIQGVTNKDITVKTFDTVIWHSIASLAVPGLTIHTIVNGAHKATSMVPAKMFPRAVALCPPLVGLASIPFIIHPIDRATDWFMDNTFRQVYPPYEI